MMHITFLLLIIIKIIQNLCVKMVDATRRKLHIPNWFSPYLEKHRIYELFHELLRELVIQQPADHVYFLKEILYNASFSRYAPRVILLAPPQVNTIDIATILAQKCKAAIITEHIIFSSMKKEPSHRPKAKTLTKHLSEVLRTDNIYYTGWILPDYPKIRKEATRMQQAGILPSHVFQFIPQFAPDLYEFNIYKESEPWINYRRTILGLRDAFKNNLLEIHLADKNLEEVADECAELLKIRKRYKAPIIPRICILGPRGCGRKTQAKQLASAFNVIYINFQYLLCQAWISESHLGSLLRKCRDHVGYDSKLLTAVVHKRILEKDCLDQGWVLVGFPNTLDDFKNFDMIDTPPNRVIFLDCDMGICRQRLISRRVNIYSGSVTNILENPMRALDPNLDIHPKDKQDLINSELKYYCENYDEIRKYCGRTASIVEANQPVQWVNDSIAAIIMRPLPNSEPRCPAESTIALSDHVDDEQTLELEECPCMKNEKFTTKF